MPKQTDLWAVLKSVGEDIDDDFVDENNLEDASPSEIDCSTSRIEELWRSYRIKNNEYRSVTHMTGFIHLFELSFPDFS